MEIKPNTQAEWLFKAIPSCNPVDCLEWPFQRELTHLPYGKVRWNGQYVAAHRLAFFFANGHWPTPQGRHTCDNPPCCNPHHIQEGTHLQNMNDRTVRGRGANNFPENQAGEANARSILTDAKVRAIRSEYIPGNSRFLANKYGVSKSVIWRVAGHHSWKHVT